MFDHRHQSYVSASKTYFKYWLYQVNRPLPAHTAVLQNKYCMSNGCFSNTMTHPNQTEYATYEMLQIISKRSVQVMKIQIGLNIL